MKEWTVGDLKRALEGVDEALPVLVVLAFGAILRMVCNAETGTDGDNQPCLWLMTTD